MTKEEAHELIDGEREYQDRLYPDEKSIGEEVLLLAAYVNRAMEDYVTSGGSHWALEVVREIAAIAQRAIEHHGAPAREDDLDRDEEPQEEEEENDGEESPF